MNIPLKWLNEFVPVENIPVRQLEADLTMSGSKVEGVTDRGAEIENVVTARVLSIEPHPDADKLVICQMDVGKEEPVQIVTGAKNLTAGDIVPAALHKSRLPGGVRITRGKLRGVVSNGMLCSFQELGLTLHDVPGACEDGILVLPPDTPVGVDIRPVLGLDEQVMEFEITSNRADCFSVIGLARETAATYDLPLKLHTPVVKGAGGDIGEHLSVQVDAPDLCPRYTARLVKNIRLAPSPAWMRQRLSAAGVRPINNIVDITNYLMLEYGQPMHAFDYDCLQDGRIIVRRAQAGEGITTLDDQPHELTDDMLVIADGHRPVAVAGVMGGANSEITDNTHMVVFESATFSGPSVRVTARDLGMRTDASARYEKGLDSRLTMPAVQRACELVEMLDAGDVVDGILDVDNAGYTPFTLPLEPERINALLGLTLSEEEMTALLRRLEIDVTDDVVTVPSFRGDIRCMADVAEEIARLYGYDRIPSTLFAGEMVQGELTERQRFERAVGETCRALGFDEAVTHSFFSPKMYDKIALAPACPRRISTTILNPLGEDFSIMRTTSLPSMLDTLSRNHSFRNKSASLFELAMTYTPAVRDGKADPDVQPREEKVLTLGTYGRMDFYQFKGAVETLLDALSIPGVTFEPDENNPSYHPGRCAVVSSNGRKIGVLGEIHPTVCQNFELDGRVLAAELPLEALFACAAPAREYRPLPKFPASTRDLAVVCRRDIPVYHLQQCIEAAVGELLESIELFDVYTGSQIAEEEKSVAYSLMLRAPDRTLTVEECDAAVQRALDALEKDFGAKLRA